jgi:hypothetical protein
VAARWTSETGLAVESTAPQLAMLFRGKSLQPLPIRHDIGDEAFLSGLPSSSSSNT